MTNILDEDPMQMFANVLDLAKELPFLNIWFIYIFFWSNVTLIAVVLMLIYFKVSSIYYIVLLLLIPVIHYLLAKKMLSLDLLKRVNQK